MKYTHIAAVLTLAVTASAAFAESVWVKAEVADLRGGKAAVYPTVGQVKKGQELTVVSRDGHWVQVQSGGTSGWIYDSSVSAAKVDSGFQMNSNTAEISTGIAARGWDNDAEIYTRNKHMTTQWMDYLSGIRKSIQPPEYVAFTNSPQGHLGQ